MGDGKRERLPCGHVGEAVFGQYFACPVCDRQAVPQHVPPERTATERLCAHCGSDDLRFLPGFTLNGRDMWFCNSCRRTHTS